MAGLSKSKYLRFLQCPKQVWLERNKPDAMTDREDTFVLEKGNEVGDLAMQYFGDYTEVPFSENLKDMIAATQELIEQGTEIICEGSFAYNNCFVSADILKKTKEGYELYEVKSSGKLHDYYLDDVSFQYYVLTKWGLNITRVYVLHINPFYIRKGKLDLKQLFVAEEVTAVAKERFDKVEKDISYFNEVMDRAEEMDCAIGEHCFKPFECPFWKYCSRLPDCETVFNLSGARKSTMFKHYSNGIVTLPQLWKAVCDKKVKMTSKRALFQAEYSAAPKETYIDEDKIRSFMAGFNEPLYFLDFESYMSAVPEYEGTRPYQQIVFQYSLHYKNKGDLQYSHKEFLAEPEGNPIRETAEHLCRDIPADVCVVAYNKSFECTRIKEMAAMFPDLSEHLTSIMNNIVDLMIPFSECMYYDKAFCGSYSIKYVLPAMFPDDPELDYSSLEGVHKGSEAMDVFPRLRNMEASERAYYRKALLEYCKLDTWAMVKIYEKLQEI